MSDELTNNPAEVAPQTVADLKPKMRLTGVVKQIEQYGAFIDVGLDTNVLIHISQLSRENVNRVADLLEIGQEISVWVQKVDNKLNQVMVTMIEPYAIDWSDLKLGNVYTGKVIRMENFGAFIDIGAEKEGLAHISELGHDYIKHPTQVLAIDEEVQVQVLGFDKRKKRINLSIKALLELPEQEGANQAEIQQYDTEESVDVLPTAMEIAFRRAMGKESPQAEKRTAKIKERQNKLREEQEALLSRTMNMQE